MFLINLNANRRMSKAWLRFDVNAKKERRVAVFANSDVFHCFIAQRIVDLLRLKLQHFFGKVQLKSDKIVDVVDFTKFSWGKDEFHTIIDCLIFNMDNDLILDENFWQKYRLVFDYNTLDMRVTDGNQKFLLASMKDHNSRLQIFENQSFEVQVVTRRAFERLIRKSAQVYLYVVRIIDQEIVKSFEKLVSIQHTIGNAKLDRVLNFDVLRRVFRNDLSNQSFSERSQDHRIDIEDVKSVNKFPYGLFKKQLNEQVTQIDYLTERNLVRSSTSSWEASVLFVKKKDGFWRMCIDYRALNAMTQRNGYSLSKIQDCLNMIGTARSFSKIDLINDYWQINVVEEDRHKTAFNIRRDKYEFCVMFFELVNVFAIFQAIMNDMLRPYLDKFVIVYLNDILIYFKNDEEHLEHVKLVIEVLHKHDYYAKSSKCSFFQQQIEFCEHIVDNGEMRMNEIKLKIIQNWSSLQTIHDVRFFLGFCVYYRRFIENFVIITESLYELIQRVEDRKYKSMLMTFSVRNVFTIIKNVMCSDRVLAQFDTFLPFIIEIDVSNFEWEAMLYQVNSDDKEHLIAFESKAFFLVERNYATHEREFLVIKESLRKWRCYVENETTTLMRTNHAELQHLKSTIKFSGRLARWLAEFEKYRLDIKYKPRSEMIVLDILSRRSDYRLRSLQINLRIIIFDEAMTVYARDGILSNEIKWNAELKKYENQFKLNDDSVSHHRDFLVDN